MPSQAEIDLIVNATNTLNDLNDELRQIVRIAEARAPSIDLDVDVDRGSIRSVTAGLATMARGLAGVASAGLALGSVPPVLAGIAAAAAEIGPAAAVGTSALLTMQLASGTLKLALVGVEDALTAALDPSKAEEFEEALKKLSPEARDFARTVRDMGGELRKVQQRVQNNFFRGFDDALRDLARSAAPAVTEALDDTSESLNRMALRAASAATELADNGTLGRALDSATDSLRELEDAPGQAVTAFGQLAAASGPSMERISRAVSDAADGIAEDLTRAFESGQMEAEIEAAIDAIAQLGTIGGNILGGLANVFQGLTTDGGGLFDILEEISQAFEDLTASEEFQTILTELSSTAKTLVENVLPLLNEAFVQLAPVIEELGPPVRDFINEIGPELIPVLQELGPLLVTLAKIFREQLPFAIEVLKGALEVLRTLLEGFAFVMEEIVLRAVRTVANALDVEIVGSLQDFSKATSKNMADATTDFSGFRGEAVRFLASVADRLSSFSVQLATWVRDIFDASRQAIGAFADVPGQVRDAMGNTLSTLFSAGQDLILGFINGMSSLLGRVRSIAAEIASTAADAVTDLLGIASPSRVMRGFGQNTVEGFVLGLQDQFPALRREMRDIAASVPQLMSDTGTASPRIQVAPQVGVQVRIGNQVVDRYVTVRVQQENQRRDRVLAQGVRV